MAHLDVATVRCRALKVVVDLLMWHGLQAFISNSDDEDNDSAEDYDDDDNVDVDDVNDDERQDADEYGSQEKELWKLSKPLRKYFSQNYGKDGDGDSNRRRRRRHRYRRRHGHRNPLPDFDRFSLSKYLIITVMGYCDSKILPFVII